MVCIYCLQDKPLDGFKKREHVLPQCFGKFRPDNLILNGVVCDECNQYFGNKLEIFLGRDTIWGVERYKYGIKPEKAPKHRRIKFRIAEGGNKGLIVTPLLSVNGELIDNEPVLQVAFLNNLTNSYEYYEPFEIPGIEELKNRGIDVNHLKWNLINKNDKEKEFLIEKLKERGYKLEDSEVPIEWPEDLKNQKQTTVIGDIRIDRVISRGLCKIAFNYLAFITKGTGFVLGPDFHGIRNFIRNDQGNQNEFFFVNQPPILEDDRRFKIKETHGHLIILDWQGLNLSARLSLFNMWTFLIKLSTLHGGLWVPVKGGHHFDVKSWDVNPLISINKNFLIHRGP